MNCPKCRAPLESHEVTPETTVDACPKCFGVFYDKGELAVPLKLEPLADSSLACPRCDARLKVGQTAGGKLVLDQCPGCGGLWFDAGEIQTLRKLAGVEKVAAGGEPGTAGPAPLPSSVAAPARPQAPAKDDAKREGPTSSGKRPEPPDMSSQQNPDAGRNPTAVYEGRRYAHFQTSIPVTTHVLGEFPWLAAAGDRVRARDFVSPPFMLSNEVTEGESVWSRGEYLSAEEVWAAFGPQGKAPPSPRGVAPAQPNPWQAHLPAMQATFLAALALAVALYAAASLSSAEKTVLTAGFDFAATDAEKSRVTEVFEVPGRASGLMVLAESNLNNHWAYANMTLINADTDEALDFGVELSYYHGVDDGEAWTEGKPYARAYLPGVPAGRYYLRVEPESDQSPLSLSVKLVRGVTLARLPFIVVLLLLVPLLWAWLRREVFENERWMESDHPRVVESDDDWEDE
ncbi:MAG: DUF4178 domain-containing protein [Elusimicrobiota bacterium]|nr:DUF4178 domain-containing protein [Elusimicrobiota bacterium]